MFIYNGLIMGLYNRLNKSIRSKLAFCFLLIILLMLLATLYSNYNLNVLLRQYDKSLSNYSTLNTFFENNVEVHALLNNYFLNKAEGGYLEYVKSYNKAFRLIRNLKENAANSNSLGKVIDLERMMQTYGENANKAVDDFRARNLTSAYQHLNEAANINKLIDSRFKTYFNLQYSLAEQQRNRLLVRRDRQFLINDIIIIFSIIFCIVFVWAFSRGITKPIRELVKNAEQISLGNFEVQPVNPVSRDEMHILSIVFNKMVESIKYYILEMESKSRIQQKLIIEENKNLKMETLLKGTQLRALQAQMNPHFLFNTLNAISQTAYIEEANQTRELIEATSDLLRHNLDRTDRSVTLEDEISCMKNYIYIQKKRFGERIKFSMMIDDNLENIAVPGLIIQPLIENAIVHGVDNYLKDGEVVISITCRDGRIIIEVEDNGVGMEETKVREILDSDWSDLFQGSKGSIGLSNVKKRLELFFGKTDVFHISSAVNCGTTVKLVLPIIREQQGVSDNVQSADS